jgi:hypothetical protein
VIAAKVAGAAIVGVPLIIAAWIALRRLRPVFWFAVALIIVGVGYLMATCATDEIARGVLPRGMLHPAG